VRELLVQTDPLVNNNNHDGDATDGEEEEGVLNPRMFEVYREVYCNGKALRLYAKQVAEWGDGAGLDRWLGGGAAGANPNLLRTTNLVTMKTARQLCAGGKAIRPFSGVSIRFDNGQALVDLISSLRPYCNKMMVHAWGRTAVDILDGINHIVNVRSKWPPQLTPTIHAHSHSLSALQARLRRQPSAAHSASGVHDLRWRRRWCSLRRPSPQRPARIVPQGRGDHADTRASTSWVSTRRKRAHSIHLQVPLRDSCCWRALPRQDPHRATATEGCTEGGWCR
jgi:hypothetical protein